MGVVYSGEHSINFYRVSNGTVTKRNTWTDFHIIPTDRPHIAYPEPNIKLIALPGTNKRLDITDQHIGGLTFGARTGSWQFYIDHDQWKDWRASCNTIYSFIHGKELTIALSDEPMMFYGGMFTVTAYNPGPSYSTITIQYDLGYDSFIQDEILPNGCPIKFVADNGIEYAKDYGFAAGADYVIKLENKTKEIEVYDLTVL